MLISLTFAGPNSFTLGFYWGKVWEKKCMDSLNKHASVVVGWLADHFLSLWLSAQTRLPGIPSYPEHPQTPWALPQTHGHFFFSRYKDEPGCFYKEWRRVYCKSVPFAWSHDSGQISLLVGTHEEVWEESREVSRRAEIWGRGSGSALPRNTKP